MELDGLVKGKCINEKARIQLQWSLSSGKLNGWGHDLEEVAQTAKENLIAIKDELRNNQTKRWQAIGTLKHVLSLVKLPWELKKHAIKYQLLALHHRRRCLLKLQRGTFWMVILFAKSFLGFAGCIPCNLCLLFVYHRSISLFQRRRKMLIYIYIYISLVVTH